MYLLLPEWALKHDVFPLNSTFKQTLTVPDISQSKKMELGYDRSRRSHCLPQFQGFLFPSTRTFNSIHYYDNEVYSRTRARTSHCRRRHFCLILFGPPNFFMSLQKSHWAQSSVLRQASHSPHILAERLIWENEHFGLWLELHPKHLKDLKVWKFICKSS